MEPPPVTVFIGKYPVTISQKRATAFGTLRALLDFNRQSGGRDNNFSVNEAELYPGDLQVVAASFERISKGDFHNNLRGDDLLNLTLILNELDASTDIWRPFITSLTGDIAEQGTLIPLTIIQRLVLVIPETVTLYLRTLLNILYWEDAFDKQILRYCQVLFRLDPSLALGVMPYAYPVVHPERINRINDAVFIMDPFEPITRPIWLDEGLHPVTHIDKNTAFLVPPPHSTTLPSREVFVQRLSERIPEILNFVEQVGRFFRNQYPSGEYGFIIGGNALNGTLDEWSNQRLARVNNDIVIDIYGPDPRIQSLLARAILRWFLLRIDPQHERVGVTIFALQRESRTYLGVKNDKLIVHISEYMTAFATLMADPFSHQQVGYDSHRGLICTPYWQCYWPTRDSVIIHGIVEHDDLIRTLYRGFNILTRQPITYLRIRNYLSVLEEKEVAPYPQEEMTIYPADFEADNPTHQYGDIVGGNGIFYRNIDPEDQRDIEGNLDLRSAFIRLPSEMGTTAEEIFAYLISNEKDFKSFVFTEHLGFPLPPRSPSILPLLGKNEAEMQRSPDNARQTAKYYLNSVTATFTLRNCQILSFNPDERDIVIRGIIELHQVGVIPASELHDPLIGVQPVESTLERSLLLAGNEVNYVAFQLLMNRPATDVSWEVLDDLQERYRREVQEMPAHTVVEIKCFVYDTPFLDEAEQTMTREAIMQSRFNCVAQVRLDMTRTPLIIIGYKIYP